ncbi:hypothetical protein Tco_0609322 [Tanacetum coccineum]
MVHLAEPLSAKSLIGEASTSVIPVTTESIATLATTFASFVLCSLLPELPPALFSLPKGLRLFSRPHICLFNFDSSSGWHADLYWDHSDFSFHTSVRWAFLHYLFVLVRCPITTEEKVQKKNDMKARSMLLMALPNEHLMTFNQYKDAKTLLQKIVSQLAILGENISQEDLNFKIFKKSLPSEWNTHVVVWRNKPDLDTMSFDDLYNNFKIFEQEVKGTASPSSSLNSQSMAFVSSPSSTNEVNTTYGVSTANTQVSPASTQVSTASTQVSTANLSDDTVYAFLASQPNGSQLVYEDLEQIHEDDIEEMDLKWQLALLA